MTAGRVQVAGADTGAAFAIAPRLALTARHVICAALDEKDQLRADKTVLVVLRDGPPIAVTSCGCDKKLDVAVLHLAKDAPAWLPLAAPVDGSTWRVTTRPRPSDPGLSGRVTYAALRLRTANGQDAMLTQLHIEERLGDYAGYSGSPVLLWTVGANPEQPLPAVAVLIEQVRWRTMPQPGQRSPVANVLFAAPIPDVLAALELTDISLSSQGPLADASGPLLGEQGAGELRNVLEMLDAGSVPASVIGRADRGGGSSTLRALRGQLESRGPSPARERGLGLIDNLALALDAVAFVRSWMPRALTSDRLKRALLETLPDTVGGSLGSDVDYMERIALRYPVEERDCARWLVSFVLRLALAANVDTDDPALDHWAGNLIDPVTFNDLRTLLRARNTKTRYRLIVSLHASPTGTWPETVSAWLLDGRNLVEHAEFRCARPMQAEVERAVGDAMEWAGELLDDPGLGVGRVDVALPTALLPLWRPEEVDVGSRLGLRHDVVVCWSDRLNPSVRLNEVLARLRDISGRGGEEVLDWLGGDDVRDLGELEDRLKDGTFQRAIGLRFPPTGQETLLELLLCASPILLWPDDPTDGWALLEQEVRDRWPSLPAGFSAAYREKWRASSDEVLPPLARLRAVWDDADWLAVCTRVRRHRAGIAATPGGRA